MTNSESGYKRHAFTLSPLDVLFFRDGKNFTASTRASGSGQPFPQTLYGALFTILLQNADTTIFKRWSSIRRESQDSIDAALKSAGLPDWIGQMRLRGPWLARMQPDAKEPVSVYLKVPAILSRREITDNTPSVVNRFAPLQNSPPGWKADFAPLWNRSKDVGTSISGYITLDGMRRFLHSETLNECDFIPPGDIYDSDNRTGIEIESARNIAKEHQIYASSFLSLAPGYCYYAEIDIPDNIKPTELLPQNSVLPWGGEGKSVILEWAKGITWPASNQDTEKSLMVLITPGIFTNSRKPDSIDSNPYSAMLPGYDAVSGWDMAKNAPKPSRYAVPAGCVYFYDQNINLPLNNSLCTRPEDIRQGWGLALKGNWNYA